MALERAAVSVLTQCDDRLTYLEAEPQCSFGIIGRNRKTTFILPQKIAANEIQQKIEPLLSVLQEGRVECHFLIGERAPWSGFQRQLRNKKI